MSSSLPKWVRDAGYVDAERSITVNIRLRDIEGAVPGHGDSCVAARCIQRALDAPDVYVYGSTAYVRFDDAGPVQRFSIPRAGLYKAVVRPLDTGRLDDIVPGWYDLVPPTGSNRKGEAGKRRKKRAELVAAGLAPPPVRVPYRPRPLIGRIRNAGVAK